MAIDANGLMEFFKEVTSWAYLITSWIEEHPVNVGVIGSVLIAIGGGVAWFFGLFKAKPKATSDSTEQLKAFIASLTAQIDKRTAELSQGNVDRGKLQQQIDELQRKLAKPEKALKEDLKRNADLGAQLDALRGRYDPNRVAAAKDAMARFDYDAAEAVFHQMRDDTTDAVKLQAASEYGLGEIAEARVDWPAAAQHYDRAADLDPTIETLGKAGEFLWRKGQYDLAEATYKQAIEIDRRTVGEDHPDFATHLNNLAGVYMKTKRYAEAVPLLEQALDIFTARLPAEHLYVVDTQKKIDTCRTALAGVE